ncbi:hypothetical protein GDO81_024816 [Engystomops pustulosus]|uniref:Uncharacterized protein n=1 Tax=Engystomops pustulosus TaxID=76066 RepID=A0AAV6YQL3_ENGPU|nr:hypothetical protein GDO81_024816 [Engystomops pustulosus]KAG8537261.1 hypothetical protein GDO81_024816 [Engystomops pustulosus]
MTKATARAAAKKLVSEIFLQVWTSRDQRVRSQNPLHWTGKNLKPCPSWV